MPTLPTFTINNQATWDRIVASFPGTTAQEKSDAYKAWLKIALRNHVIAYEAQQIRLTTDTEVETNSNNIRQQFNDNVTG